MPKKYKDIYINTVIKNDSVVIIVTHFLTK